MHYVAILHHIFLTFNAYFPGFATLRFTSQSYIVVIFDYLGTDKTFLDIGVYHTGTLRSFAPFAIGPSANLYRAGSELCLKVEKV